MMPTLLHRLYQWLLPFTCILCGQNANHAQRDLCDTCLAELPWIHKGCHQCGGALASVTNADYCGRCLPEISTYLQTIALFSYQDPITHMISKLKFQHELLYARLLGELLAKKLKQHYHNTALPEIILPMPLHHQRLRERGFNQALEIARPVAKQLNLPINAQLGQRLKPTRPQAMIPATERAANVKQAFAVNSHLSFKHIAIIDDVVTTGHTVGELSQCLLKKGVEKISIWCIAKTDYLKFKT